MRSVGTCVRSAVRSIQTVRICQVVCARSGIRRARNAVRLTKISPIRRLLIVNLEFDQLSAVQAAPSTVGTNHAADAEPQRPAKRKASAADEGPKESGESTASKKKNPVETSLLTKTGPIPDGKPLKNNVELIELAAKRAQMKIMVVEAATSSSSHGGGSSKNNGSPQLPLDPDTKVPYALRQRMLRALYEQYKRLKAGDAPERALSEEKSLHERSEKHTYQSNAASVLVQLRKCTQLPPAADQASSASAADTAVAIHYGMRFDIFVHCLLVILD